MVYVLALACSLANALCSVFQRMGVETAPESDTMRPSLLLYVVKRGIWLAGFALMVASFLLQAVALHLGNLTIVQPILTTELLFLVLILGYWFHFNIGWREILGASAAGLGLAGFLVFASPGGGNSYPGTSAWLISGGCCTAAIVIFVLGARRGPRWWRAAAYGTSAAISFAFTAALIKVVADYVATDWTLLFHHWEPYAMAVFGVAGVFLTQNAYMSGPIAASQSTIVLVDPFISILLGIGLFGDELRTGGAYGPLEAISLLVLFGGVFALCQSPLVAGVKGEGEERSEMLGDRHLRRQSRTAKREPTMRPDAGPEPALEK